MDKPIIRGETESYGHNDSMVWAYVLVGLVILMYVVGFGWAIFFN